jgi:hypothetical protein
MRKPPIGSKTRGSAAIMEDDEIDRIAAAMLIDEQEKYEQQTAREARPKAAVTSAPTEEPPAQPSPSLNRPRANHERGLYRGPSPGYREEIGLPANSYCALTSAVYDVLCCKTVVEDAAEEALRKGPRWLIASVALMALSWIPMTIGGVHSHDTPEAPVLNGYWVAPVLMLFLAYVATWAPHFHTRLPSSHWQSYGAANSHKTFTHDEDYSSSLRSCQVVYLALISTLVGGALTVALIFSWRWYFNAELADGTRVDVLPAVFALGTVFMMIAAIGCRFKMQHLWDKRAEALANADGV